MERGEDEALRELDEYLHGGDSGAALDPGDLPWEPGTFRLFVTHTHPHAETAEEMRRLFARWRIDAFVAHTTIEPSSEWVRVIEAALSTCDALAVLVTPDLLASKWCDQEVGYCVARKVPIVPVRLGADPHGFIGKYQAARVEPPGTPAYVTDAVFRALARQPRTTNQMAAPVVYRYARSTNYEGARSNFELLRHVPGDAWTRELVEVVERAEQNRQVRDANVLEPSFQSMPEAAAELLAPIRERLGMNAPVIDDDIPF